MGTYFGIVDTTLLVDRKIKTTDVACLFTKTTNGVVEKDELYCTASDLRDYLIYDHLLHAFCSGVLCTRMSIT